MKILRNGHIGRARSRTTAQLDRAAAREANPPWWWLPRLHVWWSLHFEPRDLWFGVYWDRPDVAWRYALDIYICVLPCLPLKLSPRWAGRTSGADENMPEP